MFIRFSFMVIFINFLLIHSECSVTFSRMKKGERIEKRKVREIPELEDWIKPIGKIKPELLNIQAIIVKDEELTQNCMQGSPKSQKRYLMCAGSILSQRHVLTSASCIHEATHIRHNLKAPLAVVVAFLKASLQVIKFNDYKVHPSHIGNPYHKDHTKHNIAIIRLACSISKENLHPIVFPKAPYTEVCNSESCDIALLRRVGKTAVVIYETRPTIPSSLRKRRSIEMSKKELRNETTIEILSVNHQEKSREMWKTSHPISFLSRKIQEYEIDSPRKWNLSTPREIKKQKRQLEFKNENESSEYSTNLEDMPFENLGMLISVKKTNSEPIKIINRKQNGSNTLDEISTTSNDIIDQYIFEGLSDKNNKARSFSTRASDGSKGCPLSGTAVMHQRIQAALVSVSCDDRQPAAPWKFTDILPNSDWITSVMKDWSNDSILLPTPLRKPEDFTSIGNSDNNNNGCNTCIYNFFINLSEDYVNCDNLPNDTKKMSKPCNQIHERKMINNYTPISKIGNHKYTNPLDEKIDTEQKKSRIDDIKLKSKKINFPLAMYDGKNQVTENTRIHLVKEPKKDIVKDVPQDKSKDFHLDLPKNLNKGFVNKMKENHPLRKKEELNMNRLRKSAFRDDYGQKILRNEYRDLNSSNIEYQPLFKKFHKLQMLLARIQKSVPERDEKKVLFADQEKVVPKGLLPDSNQETKYIRDERKQPIADSQYAVYIPDKETGAENSYSLPPGFNSYLL